MDNTKLINKLNEVLRHELTGLGQYLQASFVVSGVWREVYTTRFSASATECLGHATIIGEKISALGGVPTVERNPIDQSSDLDLILKTALQFESDAVKHYNEALALAEHDRALTILLEDILKEEQDGVDEITLLLKTPT